MKKILWANFIAAILLLSFSVCRAQDNYQPGYIILNDGTRVGAFIALNDDAPWYNQRYIRYKDSAAFAADPNVKSKKIKVDDMKCFQAGTRIFDKIHYVNLENLQLKSMGTNDHMMERLAMGRINAHRFYQYPQDFVVYMASDDEVAQKEAEKKNDLIKGYKILVQKDDETKLHDAFDFDLQKYFKDTPEVLEKFQSGGYGNQPIAAHMSLAQRMVSLAKKSAFKPEEADGIIAALNDYNDKNAGKK
jgi:hypothetical protein